MRTFKRRKVCGLIATVLLLMAIGSILAGYDDDLRATPPILGRIVAIGIPGVSAVSPVGTFLPGGPIHDNPAFAEHALPGRVLDPARILVGSTSNFGASPANPQQLPGAFLSIDPRGVDTLIVPPGFAAAGGQASTLGGRVQMYSSQSSAFLNSIHNPSALSAGFTGVSNPLGISINNAFGRLWPANAPTGLSGIGTSTILDPAGEPLAGAPNSQAGGVFAGNLTPRLPVQVIPGGLHWGAVGTAFLGRAPGAPTRAVFSVVLADGSIIQAQTAAAVDGLAPPGTVGSLLGRRPGDNDEDRQSATVGRRLGVIFNYSPERILYICEPLGNTIAAVRLSDDGTVFHAASVQRLHSRALDQPVDLAPVEIETSDPDWASNTTLDTGSDFYVANRGNNTIVRMRQDGTVVAVRAVRLAGGGALGNGRLNGIASSPDGSRIWVTIAGQLPGLGNWIGPSDSINQWKYSSSTDERLPAAPYWSAMRQYGVSASEARRKEIVSGRLNRDRNPSPTSAAALHSAVSSHSAQPITLRIDRIEQTAGQPGQSQQAPLKDLGMKSLQHVGFL